MAPVPGNVYWYQNPALSIFQRGFLNVVSISLPSWRSLRRKNGKKNLFSRYINSVNFYFYFFKRTNPV